MAEVKKRKRRTATAERTRQHFIKVARDLFASLGFRDTTMNGIARSAGKSRRTLYTYFSTKEDIYLEVIKEEFDFLYSELEKFVNQPVPTPEKLMRYIGHREEMINNVVMWNGTLEAEFFNDIATLERARVRFDVLERRLIRQMLQEGISRGYFRPTLDPTRTTMLLHACLKGLEVPYIRGQLGRSRESLMRTYLIVYDLILKGIGNETEDKE